jgi:hypothetical protein
MHWLFTLFRPQGCSNCNGGVSPANVACAYDPQAGSTVLQLTTHGDQYTGDGPAGVFRNLSQRGGDDEFSGWAYPGYQPTCSPFCDVRRVGGAVMSLPSFGKQTVPQGSFDRAWLVVVQYPGVVSFFKFWWSVSFFSWNARRQSGR